MLRVLGQRFPQEVDSAVAKISRNVAKTKAATSKAGLREDDGSSDDDGDDIKAARQEAALREEALSSLLVSTFAGAELAQRLPLEQQQGEDVSGYKNVRLISKLGVLWHAVNPSGAVCCWSVIVPCVGVSVHHATRIVPMIVTPNRDALPMVSGVLSRNPPICSPRCSSCNSLNPDRVPRAVFMVR